MTTSEQRLIALDRANATRLARAALKRELRDGKRTFRQALDAPVAGGMIVWALLKAKRGVGPSVIFAVSSKLTRRDVQIGYQARIGSLSQRQKLALVDVVESLGPKPPRRKAPKPVKLKPAPRPTRPELVAAREAAQVAVENPPPRCTVCKAQLLAAALSGMCTFCEIETAEAA